MNTATLQTLPLSSFEAMLPSKQNSDPSLVTCKEEYLTVYREAKFVYDAWKNPKTLDIISKIAGVELVPIIDYEIGHVNISVPGKKQEYSKDKMIADDDNKAVVDWHRDSYPFVCVLMMSDTAGMQGGETALRTGTGEIMKVRGPEMVGTYSFPI